MPVNAVEKWSKTPLAANLRAERKRLKLRSTEVARAVGIHQQTLLKLESGDFVTISPDVLLKLATILHTTPNALLGVTHEPDTASR
jgi:transcriptional regulator with XRE-family HTH domain